jgi:hypothetical protein
LPAPVQRTLADFSLMVGFLAVMEVSSRGARTVV